MSDNLCAVFCSLGRLFIPGISRVLLAVAAKVCGFGKGIPSSVLIPGWSSASLSPPALASCPWLGTWSWKQGRTQRVQTSQMYTLPGGVPLKSQEDSSSTGEPTSNGPGALTLCRWLAGLGENHRVAHFPPPELTLPNHSTLF